MKDPFDIKVNSIPALYKQFPNEEACRTHFKRMILGAYRNVHTKKYLQKYVDEFIFRYNLRDINASDMFNCFLCCSDGRITHKEIKETKWIELTENKQSLY